MKTADLKVDFTVLSFPPSLQMSALSRQVTAVSQELQEMTRLLKPLYHNPSALLLQSALTPPPSVSSHSCSPAPPLLTRHSPVDYSNDLRSGLAPDASLLSQQMLQGEFYPLLQLSPSQTTTSPPVLRHTSAPPLPASHCSAPPSLNCSPHEHTLGPHPHPSSSIPSLSLSSHPLPITPILVDLSEPSTALQTQSQLLLPHQSQSESQLQSHRFVPSYSHSHSQPQLQPLLQPPSMTSHPQEPHPTLQGVEWGKYTTQLNFVDEGQQSV